MNNSQKIIGNLSPDDALVILQRLAAQDEKLAAEIASLALAYYWEHKETLDADIERRLDYAEQSRQEARTSPLATRLRNQD